MGVRERDGESPASLSRRGVSSTARLAGVCELRGGGGRACALNLHTLPRDALFQKISWIDCENLLGLFHC